MIRMILPLYVCFLLACSSTSESLTVVKTDAFKVTFGSCNNQDFDQILWDDIADENSAVWVWLGDNIYGDSEDMSVLRAKYAKQKSNEDYTDIRNTSIIMATWDDHDYGENNAGKHYPMRVESQEEFLEFIDAPLDDPRRSRPGIYTSYDIDHAVGKIKFIMLDTRYFRDDPIVENGVHLPNPGATILGENQWEWLEKELESSEADVHIFASGIQIIPEEHRFEKWSNFPTDRNKLFDLLHSKKINHPIFISGDRHIGEISKINYKGSTFYEITSSGLTHGWSNRRQEANQHRLGNIVYDINYGVLLFEKSSGQIKISTSLKSNLQELKASHILQFN